jgi:hypothetical protein
MNLTFVSFIKFGTRFDEFNFFFHSLNLSHLSTIQLKLGSRIKEQKKYNKKKKKDFGTNETKGISLQKK